MNYKTLGVLTTALIIYGPGQFVHGTLPAEAKTPYKNMSAQQYLKVLKTERNGWERARAATQLGILGDPIALEQLHKSLLSDLQPQVRINSANAIARINQRASAKKLLQAIPVNRGKTDVQLAIIRALGDMGPNSKEFTPVIMRFLKSPNPYVREVTVESLINIQDPRALPVLNKLLEIEEELVVKLTLTKLIVKFKSPSSIPILEKIAARPKEHMDVKALARDSLDKLAEMNVH